MFPHSDQIDGYCSGSIYDSFIMGCCSNSRLVHGVRVHVFVLPNQISWVTLHEQVDKRHATAASSRMSDQLPGFIALDDTLMWHAFARRVIVQST